MAFHNKLYQLRKNNGLSQEELGDKLNVSRQTVSKWELGESTPDMEKLVMLSDYFNISLDELVLEKEGESKEKEYAPRGSIILEKVFTKENKAKSKKAIKIAGIILAILLAIDLISLFVFLIVKYL